MASGAAPTAKTLAPSGPVESGGASSSLGPAFGLLALAVLAVAALVLARKRLRLPRRLMLVETLALGGRRSLCLAKIDDREVLLAVSEAGVQQLESTAASLEEKHRALPGFEGVLARSQAEQELAASLRAASARGATT